jgi:Beta-ketoacyl synthase, N-terminal domain
VVKFILRVDEARVRFPEAPAFFSPPLFFFASSIYSYLFIVGELGEPEPIVIVGMACRVPKARNVDQFWDNLVNGVDAVTKVHFIIKCPIYHVFTFL